MLKMLFIYILFSIILFFLNNYLKVKVKTGLNEIIFPLVYLILVCTILESNNLSYSYIFLIIIFNMLIEMFYNYLYKDNRITFNMKYFLKINIILIILSVLLEGLFLNNIVSILPSMDNIKVLLWIFICIYLFSIGKDIIPKKEKEEKESPLKNKEYILSSYTKYKIKYNEILKYDALVKDLVYSYIIYEGYNTSVFRRKIDNFLFGKVKKISKLGIMQINTKTFITDEESIRLVGNKIERIYEKSTKKDYLSILKEYEKDNKKLEVISNIYKEIEDFKALN